MEERPKKVRVGSGWIKDFDNGKRVIRMSIQEPLEKGTRLEMWPNGFKEDSNGSPDYIIYLDTYVRQ